MRGGTMTPTETVLSALRDLGHNPKSTHDGWQCCCPAHEDRTPSLSIKVGDDGCALVHCHAGCSIDSICEALKLTKAELFTHNNTVNAQRNPKVRATPKQPPKLFGSAKAALEELEKRKGKRSANWVYRNAKGEPVGIIARWDKSEGGKEIRPISRIDDGKSWISGGMTLPRPLYRLPELLEAPASTLVYVVEGEKAAEAAVSLGVVATTSPHGSKSAGKADWSPLSGRSVVILPDNDDAGEAYANDVATLAQQAGATAVRIVRLVELWAEMPKGGDIADLVEHRKDDLEAMRREIEAMQPTTTVDAAAQSAAAAAPRSQAESLVSMALDTFRLGQNLKREPFAVRKSGANVASWLSGTGGALKDEMAFEYRKRHKGVMNSTAFADALATLRGEASNATLEPSFIRVGANGEGVAVDLATTAGEVVLVDATGWRIVDRSPILFQRTALTGELPIPVRGGSLESLRALLNVTAETWPILLGWLVAALIPDMPHPILMFGGQQGTGKTTAARYICGLFDPSGAPTRSQPRDPEQWAMSVANGWATVIDNVSKIPDWWSDALCKAVTGDGWVRRTLYTNCDVSVLSFKRVIALTSIDAGALRGDLGERLVLVDLEPISETKRRTEKALDREYRSAHPEMLGALFDLVAKVLSNIDTVEVKQSPRMADFARVLAAVDASIGSSSLALYVDQGKRIAGDVVDADAIGSALVEWMNRRQMFWSGTAGHLMEEIKPLNPDRTWPRNVKAFGSRLRRLIPALALQGIFITPPKADSHKRVFEVQTTAPTAQQPKYATAAMKTTNDGRAVETGTAEQPSNSPSEMMPFSNSNEDSGLSGCLGCSPQELSDECEWGTV